MPLLTVSCRAPAIPGNWMLRSAWLSQELLVTFNGTLSEVSLVPNHDGDGTFLVTLSTDESDFLLWSRSDEGCFPEAKELKQRVRDILEPNRSLGHSDRQADDTEDPTLPRGTGRTAVQRLLQLLRGGRDR
mmetsp:Transcript_36839/g.73438  ORF Transcript_36839/g.73438 Transcript_36839/m.73438 type:complete len:131 (-) Transcript_36839:336-728(-)